MTRRHIAIVFVALAACPWLSGCMVMGYSNGSGFWIWPGSIVLTVVLLLWFFLRR